jgi:hypothetical protein
MTKPRLVLLTLLAVGILLEVATIYGGYHPLSKVGNSAITFHIIFLLVVPVVVWRIHGERLLRTVLICSWAAYLVMWCLGIYRMYRD